MTDIRVITPIISKGFRDDTLLRRAVADDVVLSSTYLDRGPASVESAVDEVLAAPGVVDAALVGEAEGMAALVIDCMLDPGLDAAREAVGIPVVGAGEAATGAAAAMGRFTIVTVLQRQERDFRRLAARNGLSHALVSVRGIGMPVLALETNKAEAIEIAAREVRAAIEDDGADAVVFGCTGMLGFARPVAEVTGLSVAKIIDPLPAAVARAREAALSGGIDKDLYPTPEPKRTLGFDAWTALKKFMDGPS